ncbi:hypothetical protein [Haladaptatus sp. ZSTT2]|uniref:hypothetical protein n=1 Tax=Haladaptatus sp. ZSTT2 TaxID=3120515 RepID=UPI00300E959A
MGNFTLFEVHLHGENGGGFQFGPTFSKSSDKDESADTDASEKSRRFGRFRRSKNDDEDATAETEIEVEDGDEVDEVGGEKTASGKGALIAILFLVGAVMLVKKLRGGGDGEAEVDLE